MMFKHVPALLKLNPDDSVNFRNLACTFFICSCVFLVLLWLIDRSVPGLVAEWSLATLFVFATAVIWALRFHAGVWKKIQVIQE
jgi:MATE family multidrug resistance protein